MIMITIMGLVLFGFSLEAWNVRKAKIIGFIIIGIQIKK